MTLTYPSLRSDSLQSQLAHSWTHALPPHPCTGILNLTVTPRGCPEMQKAPPPSPNSSPTSACHARVEAESAEVLPAPSTAIVSPSSSTTLKSRSSLYFLLFTCRPERRFCAWDERGSHGGDGQPGYPP